MKIELAQMRGAIRLPFKTPWKEITDYSDITAGLAVTAIREQYGPLLPGLKFFAPSETTMTESPGNEKIDNYEVEVGVEVLATNMTMDKQSDLGSDSIYCSVDPLGKEETLRAEGMLIGELSRLGIVPSEIDSDSFAWKWLVERKGN